MNNYLSWGRHEKDALKFTIFAKALNPINDGKEKEKGQEMVHQAPG
jgi:hypothetical protein